MRAFEFEMTAERAREAAGPLERVLWSQNDALEARVAPYRRGLWLAGMALDTFALAMSIYAFVVSHRAAYGGFVAAFMALAVLFYYVPQWLPAARRFARRSLSRTARKMLARAEAKAPYRIAYTLDAGTLVTEAPHVAVRYEVPLARVRRVVAAGWVVGLFERPGAQLPRRVIYVPDETDREALLTALAQAGAEIRRLSPEPAAPAAAGSLAAGA